METMEITLNEYERLKEQGAGIEVENKSGSKFLIIGSIVLQAVVGSEDQGTAILKTYEDQQHDNQEKISGA